MTKISRLLFVCLYRHKRKVTPIEKFEEKKGVRAVNCDWMIGERVGVSYYFGRCSMKFGIKF